MTTTSVLIRHSSQPQVSSISGPLRMGPYLPSDQLSSTETALYEFKQALAVADANRVAAYAEEEAATKRVYEGKICMQVLEYRLEKVRRALDIPGASNAAAYTEEEAAAKRVQEGKSFMQMLEYRLRRTQERRKLVEERAISLGNQACGAAGGAAIAINALNEKASLDAKICRWGSEVALALSQDIHPSPSPSALALETESVAGASVSNYAVGMGELNEVAERAGTDDVAENTLLFNHNQDIKGKQREVEILY